MITALTLEQEALIPIKREEWLKVGLSTQPADRDKAEQGVRLAYEAAGLNPPEQMIWVDSPLAGCYAASLLAKVRDQVRDQVWDQVRDQVRAQVRAQVGGQVGAQVGARVWDQVRAQVRAQVQAQVGDQVRGQVGAQVWDQVRAQGRAQVRAQVGGQVEDQIRGQVEDQIWAAVHGQHQASYLAFCDFFVDALPGTIKPLQGILQVARSAGWWWPFENAVVISERPVELHLDPKGRLHNTEGMALQYPDGFGIWAIHGVRVNERIVMQPHTLTVEEITDEPNAEIRRVMREQYGYDKYLAGVGAAQINTRDKFPDEKAYLRDLEWGKLWRAELPTEDEPLVMVEVINSTPEPDGSNKTYFLRVPDEFQTAHAAVAWTFGLEPHSYQPVAQT